MKKFFLLGLIALPLLTASIQADVLVPGYSGFQRITLVGNSDSILAAPFARAEVAGGRAASVTASQVFFQGSPAWQPGQFVYAEGTQNDYFYLLITSGTKEGSSYPITGNDASSVTVDLEGDNLSTLAAGDVLSIVPYWTLSTLFPGGSGIHATTTPGTRNTEVLLPDLNATGINSSPARTFYFWNNAWFEVGQGTAPRDHQVIPSDSYFIVRHNIAANTEWLATGAVIAGDLRLPIGVNPAAKRDNAFGLQRPTSVTLADSGLIASGAFTASPTPGNRTDELFVYDNGLVQKNKSPSATYYYWNGAWRKVGAGSAIFDTTPVFTPGTGFLIRKKAVASAPEWTNAPNY